MSRDATASQPRRCWLNVSSNSANDIAGCTHRLYKTRHRRKNLRPKQSHHHFFPKHVLCKSQRTLSLRQDNSSDHSFLLQRKPFPGPGAVSEPSPSLAGTWIPEGHCLNGFHLITATAMSDHVSLSLQHLSPRYPSASDE